MDNAGDDLDTGDAASVAPRALGLASVERRAAFERVLTRMIGTHDHDTITIGRYEFVRRLGAGGMGVVYLVRDPELDRLVAIKVLHPGATEDEDASERRMRREARAMARLDHANVVRVYEVGEHKGQMYLVMEYIEGTTLLRWLAAKPPRGWQEVVRVFLAAGEGLVAAHAAGLTHGDFKPDNVLIADDGAVKVSDFGLVRTHERASSAAPTEPMQGGTSLGATMQTYGVFGTPRYMAPEQFGGSRGDPKSDQFSYCVALYAGLHGVLPFSGRTFDELQRSVCAGLAGNPSGGPRIPAGLHRVVARGLAVAPEERWPAMSDLLARLRWELGARARRRRRGALAVLAVAGLAMATAGVYERYDVNVRMEACRVEGERIADVWNDDARSTVRESLMGVNVSYAAVTAEKVVSLIDRYVDEWQTTRTEACIQGTVDEHFDSDTMARARWCLDERHLEVSALVRELSRADESIILKAVPAATGLALLSPCVDAVALNALPAPPEELRVAIFEIRTELAGAHVLQLAGQYAEGLRITEAALARAEALAWPPITADIRRYRAVMLSRSGSYQEAEDAIDEAYHEAVRARAWNVAGSAANEATFTIGYKLARHGEGRAWSRSTEVMEILTGDPLGMLRADRLEKLGIIATATGDYDRAKTLHEQALAILEAALGREHLHVSYTLNSLANVYKAQADFDQARVVYERALGIREEALGPGHPDVATVLNNLGALSMATGDLADARARFEQSLAIRRRALKPGHRDTARNLVNLAVVLAQAEDYAQAASMYEQAIEIFEATLGPDHPDLAMTLSNLAAAHLEMGDLERSIAGHRRALEIFETALGPNHHNVAQATINLGSAHLANKDLAAAKLMFARSLGILEETLDPNHPEITTSLIPLADIALMEHRPGDALSLMTRAVTILEKTTSPPEQLALARFTLARALADSGQDRDRANELAREAADVYEAQSQDKELAAVKEWLRSACGRLPPVGCSPPRGDLRAPRPSG